MNPWSTLAPYGKTLSLPGGGATKGGELFYYDSAKNDDSSDKPTLILVPGLGDEADTWRHVFLPLVNAGYRVIAPDLPGFGRSIWKGRITMNCHFNAVVKLLTMAASPECPAVLIGSSLGAGISEMAASMRPDLVKSLILIDGCFPLSGKLEMGFFLMSLPFLGRSWYRGFRKNHEGAWKSLYPYYNDIEALDARDREFLRERVIARVESSNQERGFFSTTRSMCLFVMLRKKDVAKKVKNYPGKINMIWGENDRIIPLDKTDIIRRLRPDINLSLISGAGHLPHQERPGETAAAILQFLKG